MGKLFKYILGICLVACCFTQGAAQVKSTNIQTIEGKKYYIHKVDKGQSLYGISKIYGLTVDDLLKANPELSAGAKAGQEIKIPFSAAPPAPVMAAAGATTTIIDTNKYITHRVAKGETVYSITRKYNITEKELNTFNPTLTQGMKEGQLIAVGEKQKKKSPARELREIRQSVAPKEKPANLVIDSSLFKPVSKPKKNQYNVMLALPFRLDQTLGMDMNELARTNSNFPSVPALAVDFYLGFKRAADSLKSADFEVRLDLQDIDDRDSAKIAGICNQPEFKQTDMIFGPLYATALKFMSKKAKEANIPIISPFTSENKILYNNIYLSKTTPSKFTLLESLADYCIDSLVQNGTNIILVTLNDKDKKETSFVSAFKKYYNEKQRNLGKMPKDTITTVRGIPGIKLAFKPGVRNVIVCLSAHPVHFTDFATQLSIFADRKDAILCGWDNITEMDNIDQSYLNGLHYTFAHQFNMNNTDVYKNIIDDYKVIQSSYPGENYFIGFDLAMYYLKLLKEQGPDFVYQLDKNPAETSYLRFKFTRPDNMTGFDNRGVYIFRYSDYHITSTGWK